MSGDNPCIGICEIEDGYCVGCGRSANEIFGDTDSDDPDTIDVVTGSLQPLPGEKVESSD